MVAYALLNEIGRGTDGKSIYIYGAAGGVGTAVIQTALLQGIEVIASAGLIIRSRTPKKSLWITPKAAVWI